MSCCVPGGGITNADDLMAFCSAKISRARVCCELRFLEVYGKRIEGLRGTRRHPPRRTSPPSQILADCWILLSVSSMNMEEGPTFQHVGDTPKHKLLPALAFSSSISTAITSKELRRFLDKARWPSRRYGTWLGWPSLGIRTLRHAPTYMFDETKV